MAVEGRLQRVHAPILRHGGQLFRDHHLRGRHQIGLDAPFPSQLAPSADGFVIPSLGGVIEDA